MVHLPGQSPQKNRTIAAVQKSPLKKFIFILVAVCFLVYGNTLSNGFVLDDVAVIQQNAFVAKGLKAIPTLLSTPYHQGFMRSTNNDTSAVNDLYRPLSMVAFAIEQQFFDSAPAPGHFINIIFFAGCVLLLFLFLDRLFGRKQTMVAFIASLFFAVHPVHTEVVANIKSLDELLCFFFAFLSLIIFINYVQTGKIKLLIVGAFCYFLSLLSKETSICFLAVIPLIFFLYINENKKRSIYLSMSSLVAALLYLAIRYFVLKAYNADSVGHIYFIDNELSGAPSTVVKFATIICIMGRYIKLLFIPYPLTSDYAFSTIPFVNFSNPWVLVSIAIYVSLILFGVMRFIKDRKDPYAFGILFFLVTIAMFSNTLFLIGATMAERFLFFPSVGFCVAIAFLLADWLSIKNEIDVKFLLQKKQLMAIVPIFLIFSVLTIMRNSEWKDNYTLFKTDLEHFPENARLWHSVGSELTTSVLNDQTDPSEKSRILNEGISDFRRSISMYAGDYKIHNELGNLYVKKQQYDSAEAEMKIAIKIAPENPVPISDLGAIYFQQAKYAQAIELSKKSMNLNPGNVSIMDNLIICYLQIKAFDSAIMMSQKALKIDRENQLAKQVMLKEPEYKKNDTLKK